MPRAFAADPWDDLLDDERVAFATRYDPQAPRMEDIPDGLSHTVRAALETAGITELYEHQSEALHRAFEGPTIVTTGTASGKSLCFQLPTLQTLTTDARARALYLYPTKALAQDQARSLSTFGLHARSARRSTTATRPGRSARRSGSART